MQTQPPAIGETVVVDLDGMLARHVQCTAAGGCDQPAAWHVRCRTRDCANVVTLCPAHWRTVRDAQPATSRLECPHCGTVNTFAALFTARTL